MTEKATSDQQEILEGLASFFRGEDGSQGIPDGIDKMADYEPVDVQLSAGIIRRVLEVVKA